MPVILGVDPGSRVTGFGVIHAEGRRLQYVASGSIRLGEQPLPDRLRQIYASLANVIATHGPHEFAIEQVFLARNADSALKLGQARGAAIVTAANHDLPVFEYSARQVKQAVVGKGGAEKVQVQHMVRVLLGLTDKLQADEADALAIAICHANMNQGIARLQVDSGGWRRGRVRSRTGQ